MLLGLWKKKARGCKVLLIYLSTFLSNNTNFPPTAILHLEKRPLHATWFGSNLPV